MNTIKVGNHTVTVYEGIDEMPIVRYQKFNRLMLIESGVGSTIEELDTGSERKTEKYSLKTSYQPK